MLEFKCQEDLKVQQTKEACTKFPLHKSDLRECLGNGQLPGPCKSFEPEHMMALPIL